MIFKIAQFGTKLSQRRMSYELFVTVSSTKSDQKEKNFFGRVLSFWSEVGCSSDNMIMRIYSVKFITCFDCSVLSPDTNKLYKLDYWNPRVWKRDWRHVHSCKQRQIKSWNSARAKIIVLSTCCLDLNFDLMTLTYELDLRCLCIWKMIF